MAWTMRAVAQKSETRSRPLENQRASHIISLVLMFLGNTQEEKSSLANRSIKTRILNGQERKYIFLKHDILLHKDLLKIKQYLSLLSKRIAKKTHL